VSELPCASLEQLREQYEEGLAAEDKRTVTQRMGLRFDQMRGGEQSEALEEMKGKLRLSLAIVNAMTPAERRNPLMLLFFVIFSGFIIVTCRNLLIIRVKCQ